MRLGFALFAGAAPEILRASAREAEGLGYSSFWVNHPGATDGLAALALAAGETRRIELGDRKSTRLNSSHGYISYAVFCLKKKKNTKNREYKSITRIRLCAYARVLHGVE